jgi:mitochondrial chaperone BCS1
LDPALLRAGRIDKKIQYKMATKMQAWALYRRFFPESRFADIVAKDEGNSRTNQSDNTTLSEEPLGADRKTSRLTELANQFAESVPADEFSTAELQGYLLTCKMKPLDAVSGIQEWIEQERLDKRERAEREEKRKEKLRESRLRAKTAIVADLVGPLQQQAASQDASSTGSSLNPTPEPVIPSRTAHPQLGNNPDTVISPKINGVNRSDL